MYRCIILPSALRIALPAYSNEVILMLHSTALAFTAGAGSAENRPRY
jgi:histidine transport system permease protein